MYTSSDFIVFHREALQIFINIAGGITNPIVVKSALIPDSCRL